MRLAPGLTAINPALGAAVASIARISRGFSRIAGVAEDDIEGRMNFKDVVGDIKQQAMAVKQAYEEGKSAVSSALER
jgi:DNA-directed RNA polymerase alpha subunit